MFQIIRSWRAGEQELVRTLGGRSQRGIVEVKTTLGRSLRSHGFDQLFQTLLSGVCPCVLLNRLILLTARATQTIGWQRWNNRMSTGDARRVELVDLSGSSCLCVDRDNFAIVSAFGLLLDCALGYITLRSSKAFRVVFDVDSTDLNLLVEVSQR